MAYAQDIDEEEALKPEFTPVEDKTEYDQAYESESEAEAAGQKREYELPTTHDLAMELNALFEEARGERRQAEEGWIRDLRQYKGVYDPEVLAQMDPSASRAFFRLTRTKVKSVDARIMDMIMPGGGDKNWQIEATPNPLLPKSVISKMVLSLAYAKLQAISADMASVPPEDLAMLMQEGKVPSAEEITQADQMLSQGQVPDFLQPTKEEIESAIKADAEQRAEKMSSVIEDQLAENRYVSAIRDVVHSGHKFGTGWLKGPMVDRRVYTVYLLNEESGEWGAESREADVPYFEFVPVWDIFPENIEECDIAKQDGIWHRYRMRKAHLAALGENPGFNKELIHAYIKAYPDGDCQHLDWYEAELRELEKSDENTLRKQGRHRYEVRQRLGWVSGEALKDHGVAIPDEPGAEFMEYKAVVWLIGGYVISAQIWPFDDQDAELIHAYRFEPSDESVYGESVPSIIRDPQGAFNAGGRAMFDNAGLTAGPILEVNLDLLDPASRGDANVVYPRKVYYRRGKGIDAQQRAVHEVPINSHIDKFLAMLNFSQEMVDEVSALPRYTHGEQSAGVARTVGGLSMLMGAANMVLKDSIRSFDEGVSKPFIRAMYAWNMQFNQDNAIKGDYRIKATASTALVAKEVRAQALEEMAVNTNNPLDAPWVRRGELNRERFRVRDLDSAKFVNSDEDVRRQMAQQESPDDTPNEGGDPGRNGREEAGAADEAA